MYLWVLFQWLDIILKVDLQIPSLDLNTTSPLDKDGESSLMDPFAYRFLQLSTTGMPTSLAARKIIPTQNGALSR